MKNFRKEIITIVSIVFLTTNAACQTTKSSVVESDTKVSKRKKKRKKYKLSKIDLSHWKVTLPIGKPTEIEPPEILDYATNKTLMPFMYNDSVSGALVFYAYPTAATTANTKYSRTELREQMVPGDNNVNWTFKDGRSLKGKLAIEDISKDSNGKYHKTIIMQIHGRLTNEQKELIGEKDNNAPPMLKIYWQNGKIRVKTKVLKNLNTTDADMLHESAWTDDDGHTFEEKVDFNKFTLEVKVSEGKMIVSLNNNEFKVYKNIHMKKWGVFENYFKAGNYFQSRDKNSFAKVKFYELTVSE
ncbi:polysaccharide lyase family 7 protein [Cellulophaga sp. 20_2_10]|uniref:polysaccharide lyase family 7 protein n=1 Tax=Cellulophaga sp. 20_2_10 TaxID=2942476 RepID=UPI00201A99FE|nr:polysaccharide lyase family 7 protein [Cellulophaga sp. 20_2_10]MCL5247702.1 polysaccharide lyase family 7 protein [Cellulophaga sp. 20_2_10]